MNVNEFDRLYREYKTATGATDTPIIIPTDKVDPGRIRVLTHVSIEDEDNSYIKCRLSIWDGAVDFFLDEAIYPEKGELLVNSKDILLGEGDILRATLTGTTTGDKIKLYAIGWEMPRER